VLARSFAVARQASHNGFTFDFTLK
jgi:hypothetical protein